LASILFVSVRIVHGDVGNYIGGYKPSLLIIGAKRPQLPSPLLCGESLPNVQAAAYDSTGDSLVAAFTHSTFGNRRSALYFGGNTITGGPSLAGYYVL
jgi:hypothetical protein